MIKPSASPAAGIAGDRLAAIRRKAWRADWTHFAEAERKSVLSSARMGHARGLAVIGAGGGLMTTGRTVRRSINGGRFIAGVLAAVLASVLGSPVCGAAEKVKMATFQANLCCLTVYVAKHLKLFEKHGVEVELVYGTGIQVANIMVSGSAEVGAFAVEHGVAVSGKGQDV